MGWEERGSLEPRGTGGILGFVPKETGEPLAGSLWCAFLGSCLLGILVPTEWSMPGRPWSVWQGVGSSGQGGGGGNVRSSGNLNFFKVELWGHR